MKKLYENKLYQSIVMIFVACTLAGLMSSCAAIQPATQSIPKDYVSARSLLSLASYYVDDAFNPTQIYGVFTFQGIPYHFVAKISEGKILFEKFGRTTSEFVSGFIPLIKNNGYIYFTWNKLPDAIKNIVSSMVSISPVLQFLMNFSSQTLFTPLVIPSDLFNIDANLFPEQNF